MHTFRTLDKQIGLLYQSRYSVGRYVSIERLTRDSGQSYYDALEAAGHGWHEGTHDIWPWLDYLLGILTAAYREFEERASLLVRVAALRRPRSMSSSARVADEFTIAEVREASLGASDSLIGKLLARLRDDGAIDSLGTGRAARWRRLPGD